MPTSTPTLQVLALALVTAAVAVRPACERASVATPPGADVCIAPTLQGPRAVRCDDASRAMFYAPNRWRRAVGLPLCWHTASAEDLTAIDGIGPAAAERLVALRQRGVAPHAEVLDAAPGIPSAVAEAAARGVTEACARVRATPPDPGCAAPTASSTPARPTPTTPGSVPDCP